MLSLFAEPGTPRTPRHQQRHRSWRLTKIAIVALGLCVAVVLGWMSTAGLWGRGRMTRDWDFESQTTHHPWDSDAQVQPVFSDWSVHAQRALICLFGAPRQDQLTPSYSCFDLSSVCPTGLGALTRYCCKSYSCFCWCKRSEVCSSFASESCTPLLLSSFSHLTVWKEVASYFHELLSCGHQFRTVAAPAADLCSRLTPTVAGRAGKEGGGSHVPADPPRLWAVP